MYKNSSAFNLSDVSLYSMYRLLIPVNDMYHVITDDAPPQAATAIFAMSGT